MTSFIRNEQLLAGTS